YGQIIEMLPEYKVSIRNLEDRLREEDANAGSFYCNYDVFKNIYQINARSVRRARSVRFLVLLTLETDVHNPEIQGKIKTDMEILKKVIFEQLRRNDVFTQFSATQYSLILTAQNRDNCVTAITRLVNRFKQKSKDSPFELQWDMKQVEG
ncbi:hypothetical protein LJB83_02875, partial [Clostridia bacterium OttesenSCG-928-F22]|nr:hypothetical protein [Clostridia bacterium OttesenSCG-928-F22]